MNAIRVRVTVAILAAAALASTPANAEWKNFKCYNGDQGRIQFSQSGNPTVDFRGEVVALQPVPSGDAKWTNGDWQLEIVGTARNLALEVPDYGELDCYLLDQAKAQPAPSPQPSQGGGLTPARSLGGNIRKGPSLDSRVIANLGVGTPVQIRRRMNETYAGYPWFEIRYKGRKAYMLGSLICSPGQMIEGTYQVCN